MELIREIWWDVLQQPPIFCCRAVVWQQLHKDRTDGSPFLGLACPSKSSFLRVEKLYCIPAIHEWWEWIRTNLISLIRNLEVVVSGDGQSDSPGHSAKYLTYFVMLTDALQEYIVHLKCMDKREVGGKSPCMEREALKRAVQKLKIVINLKEVVTDASSSIIKMMGTTL